MINLVIVAHPDDEVLGFGGTGARQVKLGEKVQPVMLCGNVEARSKRPSEKDLMIDINKANEILGFEKPVLGSFPNLELNTVPHIDLVKFIEEQIVIFKPDRIFTHHPYDLNDDHKKVSNACMAASRLFQRREDLKKLQSLYFMEILSSTDWTFPIAGQTFLPNVFIDISSTIEKKISSLKCYRNVMRDAPHPRSEEVLRGHASYRGSQSGFLSAESFQQVYRCNL